MDLSSTSARSGIDLKIARMRQGIRAIDLARQLSVSKQRVSQIESSTFPTRVAVRRYLDALDALSGKR